MHLISQPFALLRISTQHSSDEDVKALQINSQHANLQDPSAAGMLKSGQYWGVSSQSDCEYRLLITEDSQGAGFFSFHSFVG